MLGDPGLISGETEQDRRQRLTSPGQADWVDLDHVRYCGGCIHFHRKHCRLFQEAMRAQLGRGFVGPKLPDGQRACRKYTSKPKERR